VERFRERLRWRGLRDNLNQRTFHCAVRRPKSSLDNRDCHIRGGYDKERQGFGNNYPACRSDHYADLGPGRYWGQPAVYGNRDWHDENRCVVDRLGRWMQRRGLRNDFNKWALHSAHRCTCSASSDCDRDFCGRSYQDGIGDGGGSVRHYGNSQLADSCARCKDTVRRKRPWDRRGNLERLWLGMLWYHMWLH